MTTSINPVLTTTVSVSQELSTLNYLKVAYLKGGCDVQKCAVNYWPRPGHHDFAISGGLGIGFEMEDPVVGFCLPEGAVSFDPMDSVFDLRYPVLNG